MSVASEATNKALVLVALDTLLNQRDYSAAKQYWSPDLILHCPHIGPGRDGLFEFVKVAPAELRYEPGVTACRRLRFRPRTHIGKWTLPELDCCDHPAN